MSDYDLRVLTDHIHDLAGEQQAAAGRILVASQKAQDLSGAVLQTHGIVCWATQSAVAEAEGLRHSAAANMYKGSEDLKERLYFAADNYDDADFRAGRNIGACGV